MLRLFGEVSAGLDGVPAADREDQAIALLALLSGGVTLARAVRDPALSERIARAVGRYAMAMTEPAAAAAPRRKR